MTGIQETQSKLFDDLGMRFNFFGSFYEPLSYGEWCFSLIVNNFLNFGGQIKF